MEMFGYVLLGAWLMMLLILGIIVISTGLREEYGVENVWTLKLIYLIVLSGTMYGIGEHFANL